MTGEQRARYALLADYSARGNPWMGELVTHQGERAEGKASMSSTQVELSSCQS